MITRTTKLVFTISIVVNVFFICFFVSRRYFNRQDTAGMDKWNTSRENIFSIFPVDSSIVFLGTSHTESFPLNEIYPDLPIKIRGVAGNSTYHLLERLKPILAQKPKKLFIEGGTNDLKGSEKTIIDNFRRILMLSKEAGVTTYVQSIFPVSKSSLQYEPKVENVNKELRRLADSLDITFIDIASHLVKNNALDSSLTDDGLHLNAKGYIIWNNILQPYIRGGRYWTRI